MYLLEQYVVLIVGEKEKMCRVIKKNRTKKKQQQSKITGICNDLVPRTARYAEKARVVARRRDRGKGREPPRKAGPRGSNRPMAAARKARQSVESGSISKTERSNLGE